MDELMMEAGQGSAASGTGKSTKEYTKAGYGSKSYGTGTVEGMRSTGLASGNGTGGRNSVNFQSGAAEVSYKVSQQKSTVSAQYRQSIAKEQQSWLDEMGLEEETNGKKEEKQKYGIGDVEELQRRLLSLETMFEKIRRMQQEAREKNKNKKKMNYSYRRVSAVISGAKTNTQASLALSTATANLSMVKRMAASGKYQEKDVLLAVAHAQKMVRTARKKCTNIKMEVQQKKRNKARESYKKQQVNQMPRPAKKQKIQRELERLKTQLKTQENQEKYRNRRSEDMELMMADMQYIRRKIELLKGETGDVNNSSVNSFQMGSNGDEIMSSAVKMENLGMVETAINSQSGGEAAVSGGTDGVSAGAE